MKNKKLLVLVLFLAVFSLKANAQDICSKNGYTVLTINGIFTDEKGALLNKGKLKQNLPPSYKNEKILVDYVYNATHLAGVGDLVDAVRQGLFDSKSDYDLVEMMSSASSKVTTQKLLLVGHSQGNFYANNFYEKVVDKAGGVPAESLGMYSVATPDNHVSGGGKYLTSDTDSVISLVVGRLKNIMTPNTHIELQKGDGNGHDFSDIYLKYRSSQIVSDIKTSFDNLEINSIQKVDGACISPQEISLIHKLTGAVLAVTDFTINNSIKVAAITFKAMNRTTISLATTLFKIAKSSLAAVGLADNKEIAPIIAESSEIAEESTEIPEPIVLAKQPEIIIENNTIKEEVVTDISEIITIPEVITPTDVIIPESSHSSSNNDQEIIVPEVVPEVIIPETVTPEVVVPEVVTPEVIVPEVVVPIVIVPEVILPVVDTTPPVITLIGESAIYMTRGVDYVESGATALDDVDGAVLVSITGTINMSDNNIQTIIYTATDEAGNISTVERIVKVSDLVYIPKYTFGTGNGDGHDWQVWVFNGSYFYDWSDTYVDNYLREQFKIETAGVEGAWSYGFVRGIFKSDPQKGFNASDLTYNTLEGNPQNNPFSIIYNITIQWDSNGYIVTIFHDAILDSTTRVDLPNMNNDLWVGWTDNMNQFKDFPSGGSWIDYPQSTRRLWGGSYMMLTPFPVYDASATNTIPVAFPSWSSEKSITSFSFDSLEPKVDGVINETNHAISLTVPYATDVTTLVPTITISDKAIMNPLAYHVATNFTNPVTYIVKAEDKTTESYVVTVTVASPTTLSSEKTITSFSFDSLEPKVDGVIDETNHTISFTVPYATDVTNLVPTISISDKATISPVSFTTNPASFVVTAEDKTTQTYVATVIISPEVITEEPDITPPTGTEEDGILPTILNYTINGWSGGLQLNPITKNVSIKMTASKKVNWMSIKIEKKIDPTIYKILQSNSTTCVDWQNTCTRVWLGDLSSGGLLQNGEYRIKVHLKDTLGKEYENYLPMTMEVYGGV